jgi:hypothetical protein
LSFFCRRSAKVASRMAMRNVIGAALALAAVASSTPLDDYLNKPDSNYGWVDTGAVIE